MCNYLTIEFLQPLSSSYPTAQEQHLSDDIDTRLKAFEGFFFYLGGWGGGGVQFTIQMLFMVGAWD